MVVRCELKIPSLGITVRHHSACLVMPNSYPRDGIFNTHPTTNKASYNKTTSVCASSLIYWNIRKCIWIQWTPCYMIVQRYLENLGVYAYEKWFARTPNKSANFYWNFAPLLRLSFCTGRLKFSRKNCICHADKSTPSSLSAIKWVTNVYCISKCKKVFKFIFLCTQPSLRNRSKLWYIKQKCYFNHTSEENTSHVTRKPVFGGFRPGKTQTGLLSYTS